MLSQRTVETTVGLFVLAAIAALFILAFKVSGLTTIFKAEGYEVTAQFDDIGQLKTRASVKISGVVVGEVASIRLDPVTFKALVTLHINANADHVPDDSSAAILTAGLLGDNYIEITPMYSTHFLKQGSQLQETHSAMILEKLIGQLLFKIGNSGSSNSSETSTTAQGAKP